MEAVAGEKGVDRDFFLFFRNTHKETLNIISIIIIYNILIFFIN